MPTVLENGTAILARTPSELSTFLMGLVPRVGNPWAAICEHLWC